MSTPSKPEELMSLQTLSRKLDLPYPTAIDLRAKGVLNPDFIARQQFLFRKSRVPELRKIVINL
jgi:hypothetical protein